MTSTQSTDSEYSSNSDSESNDEKETGKKTKKKSNSKKTPNKNDKGRFEKTPLKQVNVGLPEKEAKRKKEDEALEKGEKKKARSERSPSNTQRGSAFTERETKNILHSLFQNKDDKDATEDFLKHFPDSTRTKQSVRNRVSRVRTDLTNSLTKVHQEDVETNGVFIFLSFFLPSFLPFFLSFFLSF